MTEAETILKLIETVDPSDRAKLDEIDARVWCYLQRIDFGVYGRMNNTKDNHQFTIDNIQQYSPHYARNRDSLKAIRPNGWVLGSSGFNNIYNVFTVTLIPPEKSFRVDGSVIGYHEELAELHAIIQAIDYERRSSQNHPNQ